jgi:hypothetical protein
MKPEDIVWIIEIFKAGLKPFLIIAGILAFCIVSIVYFPPLFFLALALFFMFVCGVVRMHP